MDWSSARGCRFADEMDAGEHEDAVDEESDGL
jgi:hypothetical protein